MNIAIGRVWQETNTFAETRTSLREFRQYTWQIGDEILPELRAQDNELAGFADVLDGENVSYAPLINATAWCGGPLLPEVVATFTDAIIGQLRRAGKPDAILFSLHGAMAGVGTPDVEGHLLTAMRACVGPELPIVVTLDHHANVTRAMVDSADAITAYRQCPHVDMRETGRNGARLLLAMLRGKIRPTMAFRKIPLVTPCEHFRTAEPPMKTWFDMAREMESLPDVASVSPFAVQPWMDVPEFGWSALAVTNNNQPLAEKLCAKLANWAWKHRAEFYEKKFEPSDAVRRAASAPKGPVVIADGADATNGGSPGDSTCLLREFLRQKITCTALLTMVDPEAVELAQQAGVGKTITVGLGAKRSRKYHQPVEVTARVARFSDGRFNLRGHIAMKVNMGRCVLLEIGLPAATAQAGSIKVVVSEFAGPGHDPEVFRHIGLEPKDAQIVVVKATVGHTDAYRDIMKENLPTECPGPSPSYLERLDYRHIPKPMYPFDKKMRWSAGKVDEPRNLSGI
ncbi:MAG: M81 family metallopeptidase [Verrucomicrobia bacterium]|nr:M81 family metallopeptidase [Verrucomicrobiota bacterium]